MDRFDDLSLAMYRRQYLQEKTGHGYSIVRIAQQQYGVLPHTVAQDLTYPIVVKGNLH
ncbi:hypothetical protein GCM10023189_51750 [Nibrella saemangeumensis]|uniref:Uncharacterized protein n=1 Tax=Nibrella saemangeumensis TaxID=1084526 RepID=A0ABP8NL31_9BACT